MTCKCDLLDRLTAEQFDISYRQVKPVKKKRYRKSPAPRPVTCTDAEQDARDTLMFNAGRFAAGARDSVAVASDLVFQRMMETDTH